MRTSKAIGYIRISQPDENPENQRYVIEKWAKENGYEVIFFPPERYTGEEDPLSRPVFRMVMEFAKTNRINVIVMTDIMRFSRKYEYTIERLAELASQGIRVIFINTPLPTLDEFYESVEKVFANMGEENPYMKVMAKALRDIMLSIVKLANDMMIKLYAAQSEAYLQEVRMRVKSKMAKLKEEGKLYYRPTLIHYIALWLSKKGSFRDLTKKDIKRAKEYLANIVEPLMELGVPKYRIHKEVLRRLQGLYRRFPQAPKSYDAVMRACKQL